MGNGNGDEGTDILLPGAASGSSTTRNGGFPQWEWTMELGQPAWQEDSDPSTTVVGLRASAMDNGEGSSGRRPSCLGQVLT